MYVPRRARFALLLVVLLGCQGAPPTVPAATPPPFTAASVDTAVATLADAGIAVRVRPAEDPLRAVATPSRVQLLRFQARNLALEASQRSGTLGADLDALTDVAGGLPASALLAAWAQTADTPASRAAGQLVGELDVDPESIVFPSLAVALFLADVTAGAPPAAIAPTSARAVAALAAEPAGGDFCAQVSEYLSAVLEGVLDPQLPLQPSWLAQAISTSARLENDPDKLRNSVAALALMVFATSISRPWTAFLVASPQEVHYLVGEEGEEDSLSDPEGALASGTKELRLNIARGEGSFAEEVEECAALADLQLEESELEGTDVAWVAPALLPHTTEFEGDLELDENGNAIAGYQLKSETPEAHRNGTLNSAVPGVTAVVKREEIADLEAAVRGLLTGGELGAGGATVAATWDRLAFSLRNMLYPQASAYVTVTWHTGPEPSPTPSPNPSPDPDPGDAGRIPCADGCAMSNGDPHIVTVDDHAYDFQAAGEFVLLRSADGSVEVQGRQVPLPESDSVTINSAVAMRVDGHRVGFYVGQDSGPLDALLDGAPVDATAETPVGAGHVRPIEGGLAWEVAFPDGSYAYAVGLGAYGINVLLEPTEALATGGRGVMGPFPTGPDQAHWLPALPDGSTVAAEPPNLEAYWNELYVRFAEAWRVSQDTSLFDYAAGESTATFAIPAFPPPENLVQLDDLTDEQRAAGEEACAGLADPIVHAQCVFDVGITSDAGWADGYESTLTLVETGALPSTGAQARVVNLYSENGQPVELDVYAYTWSAEAQTEVAALVATVPFGQASDWFNPGFVQSPFSEEPHTRVEIFRRGEQADPLSGIGEFLGPGTRTTIALWQEEVFEGEPGAWRETIFEAHPEFPVLQPLPDAGVMFTRNVGVRAGVEEPPTLYLSVGDGCLESPIPGFDPEIPNSQPVGNDLVVPAGQHTLTVHADPPLGELARCDQKPLGPGAPISAAPGDRFLVFPYRLPGATDIQLLVLPFGR